MTLGYGNASRFQAGKRVRIFLGEAQLWQGKPLHRTIVELAWRQGIAGATIVRGVEGFGPEQHLTTERFVDLADNLPILLEIVDTVEQIDRLLPLLDEMVPRGMITVTDVQIVQKGK
jgi:PII-like signaling protein